MEGGGLLRLPLLFENIRRSLGLAPLAGDVATDTLLNIVTLAQFDDGNTFHDKYILSGLMGFPSLLL